MRKLAPMLALLALVPGCLFGSDSDAEHRPLDFVSLAVPAEIGPGDARAIEVSFVVGPDGCWDLDGIGVRREGVVLRVEGRARKPELDGSCTQEIVYGKRALAFPPLPPGEYVVLAGQLFQNVTVTAAPAAGNDRFVYLGSVRPDGAGCDLAGHTDFQVAFSGLPDVVNGTYLVIGEITGADPCMYANLPDVRIDYFVTVELVLPPDGLIPGTAPPVE